MAEETQVVEETPIDQLPLPEYKARKASDAKAAEEAITNPPKVEATPAAKEADEEDDGESVENPKDAEKKKSRGGFQHRLEQKTRENAALAKRIEELEAKSGKAEPAKSQDQVNAMPKPDQFGGALDYYKAVDKYLYENPPAEEGSFSNRADYLISIGRYNDALKENAARMSTVQAYTEKITGIALRYPDYPDLIKENENLSIKDSVLEVLADKDIDRSLAVEMMYHLVSNPELLKEMQNMSPSRAANKAWQIAEELEAKEGNGDTEEKTEKPRERAKVPPPIKPVGSSGNGHSTVPMEQMDLKAYRKARESGRVQ